MMPTLNVRQWIEAIFWLTMLGLMVLAGGQILDKVKTTAFRSL